MAFLTPITALVAAAVTMPLLVLLYLLKPRAKTVRVSSTLLWLKAVQDLQVRAPFRKLRRHLLLLLQVLVLGALLLASARPTLPGVADRDGRQVILIDHSASMSAKDVAPNRLEQGKKLAMQLIDHMGEGGPDSASGGAMVISFSNRSRIVQPFTTDRMLLRRAVRSIRPTGLPTRLQPALQVIEPLLRNASTADRGQPTVVYLISDGRLHDTDPLSVFAATLRYLPVGQRPDNVGIVSLAGRRLTRDRHRAQVYARLANYGPLPIDTNLTVTLDQRVERVVPLTVPAASKHEAGTRWVRFELELPSSALVELRHDHADALTGDDMAWLMWAPPKDPRVLLVTTGNAFLAHAIEAVGTEKLVIETPSQYESRDTALLADGHSTQMDGFDLVVFDGHRPKRVPPVCSVSFASAVPLEGLALRPTPIGSPQVVLDWRHDHPLLRHVAIDDLVVGQPGRIAVPETGQVLANGQAGPLMVLVESQGIRHVVVGFDPRMSNWPLQISFPVFITNCIRWLAMDGGHESAITVRPGLPLPGPSHAALYAQPHDSRPPSSPPFLDVGLYETAEQTPQPWNRVGVSLLDPAESNLQPADRVRVSGGAVTVIDSARVVRREIWPWLVATALVLLMVEWVVYTRRWHL